MDYFNLPPGIDLLPPEQVRIKSLKAEPWPESNRVKVFIELTPFQQKPNLDLTITDEESNEMAFSSVIETMVFRLVLTMHLPAGVLDGSYRLTASLYYSENDPIDSASFEFSLPAPAAGVKS